MLERKTAKFCDQLNNCFREQQLPFEVTRAASIFWLHVKTDSEIRRIEQIPSNNVTMFANLFHRALDGGVYLAPSGYEVNSISLAHSDELLERAQGLLLKR
jgi:glutamate-1-semialdehyde 2,1-aminomutase